MGLIDLKNITDITIETKREHSFEVCFDLAPEVLEGFQMDTAYTCEVKHWETNASVLFTASVSVSDTVITVSSDNPTGLRLGEYFYSIQPATPTKANYLTIQGDFIVD